MIGTGQRKFGLGTAQFGLTYGISGPGHCVETHEVHAILRLAAARGVTLLDTAPTYGNSERVLGERLRRREFSIVTKTPPLHTRRIDAAAIETLERTFTRSLQLLRRSSVYAVLIHNAGDLLAAGGERLYDCAVRWRAHGRTTKIGVSVYTKDEIDALIARYALDLIQVPVNVLDQRLVADGTLARLKSQGMELHARSVFLQGLLLMEPSEVPAALEPARAWVARFREATVTYGASALASALRYVAGIPEIDRMVVGVHSASQLSECLDALDDSATADYADFRCDDERVIDPRRWNNA